MIKILERLYYGDISPLDEPIETDEYIECRDRYREMYETFEYELKSTDMSLYRRYVALMEKYVQLQTIEDKESYTRGFSLCMKLIIGGLVKE